MKHIRLPIFAVTTLALMLSVVACEQQQSPQQPPEQSPQQSLEQSPDNKGF